MGYLISKKGKNKVNKKERLNRKIQYENANKALICILKMLNCYLNNEINNCSLKSNIKVLLLNLNKNLDTVNQLLINCKLTSSISILRNSVEVFYNICALNASDDFKLTMDSQLSSARKVAKDYINKFAIHNKIKFSNLNEKDYDINLIELIYQDLNKKDHTTSMKIDIINLENDNRYNKYVSNCYKNLLITLISYILMVVGYKEEDAEFLTCLFEYINLINRYNISMAARHYANFHKYTFLETDKKIAERYRKNGEKFIKEYNDYIYDKDGVTNNYQRLSQLIVEKGFKSFFDDMNSEKQ